MRGVDDEDPIEEFTAYAADPAFHDRVQTRCLSSGAHDPDALGAEYLTEQCGELAVPVTNKKKPRSSPLGAKPPNTVSLSDIRAPQTSRSNETTQTGDLRLW